MMGDVLVDGYYRSDDPRLERGSDKWMEANQSSARLFEKSKISALRGMSFICSAIRKQPFADVLQNWRS